MDDNDDKLLAAYDLSAWEAPPAPVGMVDRIVARARMPAAPAMKTAVKWRRTAVVAGSSIAVIAAALAFVVFGTERAPQDGGGLVRATNAQRLELGPSFATLDAGTELHWQRRGTHVEIAQLKGGAVWNVSSRDTFVIETGSPGATVASVEATGASLRTEVQMLNRTDARVIGIGSAVAALVSITTVVVYEGHVKATSNGQVVNIQSGSTAQFPPSAPGNQPKEQLGVGAGPIAPPDCADEAHIVRAELLHKNGSHIDALIELLQVYACHADAQVARRIAIESCDAHDLGHATQYYLLASETERTMITDACTKVGIDLVAQLAPDDTCDAKTPRQKGEDFLNNGMDTAALSQFEQSLKCKDDVQTKKMAYIASCRLKNLTKARKYYADLGSQASLVQVCMRFGIDPSDPPPQEPACDEVSCVLNNNEGACCAKWKKRGDIREKNDREIEKAANENRTPKIEPLPNDDTCDEVSCVLNNYGGACCTKYKRTAATPPTPTCDAAGPKSKGEAFLNNGEDTKALSMFELSLKCKSESQTMKMAYIASCRLKNATKAKLYFKTLGEQPALLAVCTRFGVDPTK